VTVLVPLVETVPIAPRVNRVRTTRRPTDVVQTEILGPASEQRFWVFLLNHGDDVGPSQERLMTALHVNASPKTSTCIQTNAHRLRNIRATHSTLQLILIPVLNPQSMPMILQSHRLCTIYDQNQMLCYHLLNHSATMGETHLWTLMCT
jgi:hypothetical protein